MTQQSPPESPVDRDEDQDRVSWNPLDPLSKIDVKIRPNLKKAIPATVVAVVLFIIGSLLGGVDQPEIRTFHLFGTSFDVAGSWVVLMELVVTAGFVLAAAVAAKAVARELQYWSERRAGKAAASAVRLITLLIAIGVIVVGAFTLLQWDLRNLLVGGAITGIVIGIAAQQTLNNFFAGLVLFFARPYVPGQRVKIRSGSMGGPFTGVIVSAGMMYTLIDTEEEGVISMPNAGLMGAAVSPAPDDDSADGDAADDPDQPADGETGDADSRTELAAQLAGAAAQLAEAAGRLAAVLPAAERDGRAPELP